MEDPKDEKPAKDAKVEINVKKEPKPEPKREPVHEDHDTEEESFRPAARAPRRPPRDNFLAEAVVRPRQRRLTYGDGFRAGIGFITAQLLVLLVTGVLTWLLIVAFKVHI